MQLRMVMSNFVKKIGKFIFSAEKCGDCHKRVKIFGIKTLKYFSSKEAWRNLQEQNRIGTFEYVSSIWTTYGAREDLLHYFHFASHSLHAWRFYYHQFWLVYLSCLIEIKDAENALYILNKYVDYHGLFDIDRFLPVAKFALNNGYSNKKIEEAVFVYDKLAQNRRNDLFKKILEGKTVAVIGNGPSEIGRNKGEEIDLHDIVIRFNNYRTAGFEKDYGSRTDVWTRNAANDLVDRKEKYQLIIWEVDYDCWKVKTDHLDILYRQLSGGENVYNTDNHRSLRKASGVDFPTTGLVLIWEIYKKFGNFDKVDFYGFNFCQKKLDSYCTHYFSDRDEKEARERSEVHHLNKEARFVLELINGKYAETVSVRPAA